MAAEVVAVEDEVDVVAAAGEMEVVVVDEVVEAVVVVAVVEMEEVEVVLEEEEVGDGVIDISHSEVHENNELQSHSICIDADTPLILLSGMRFLEFFLFSIYR